MVMLSQRTIETCVGIFLLAAILSLIVLAFKVSGLTSFFKREGYDITAVFDDVGQLKVRGPVKIAGVTVGEVTNIRLDAETFRAIVTMRIDQKVSSIPDDSSASILTSGLLGDNYIAITPMYNQTFLHSGSEIQDTHSAMILEKLIGQFLFKVGNSETDNGAENDTNSSKKVAH
jgi:phospholipid/cholesterol/gamma-HCH transport system substrate-binding protein